MPEIVPSLQLPLALVMDPAQLLRAKKMTASGTAGHVFVVEDNQALRESMQRILVSQGYRVQAFEDPLVFLDQVSRITPAVLLLDMRMPTLTGLEIQARLIERRIDMPVVFVSGLSTVQQAVTALENGALQFLVKPVSREHLLEAVRKGVAVDRERAAKHQRQTAQEGLYARLAPREREVLQLLLAGHGNLYISAKLRIAPATVKQHKSNIKLKLNVDNMAELVTLMRAPE